MPRVKVIDTAGFGDPTLSIKDIVKLFKKFFSSKDKIDIIVFVTKSTDSRLTLQERATLISLKKFMTIIKPDSFFCLFSHADVKMPNEDFIKGRLAFIKEHAGIECLRDNVFMFKKDAESLKGFMQKIRTNTFSGMHVNLA
jgi:hypothetical protein